MDWASASASALALAANSATIFGRVRDSSDEWEETSRVVDQCEVNCTSVVKVNGW